MKADGDVKQERAAAAARRVLVVDDDPDSRRALEHALHSFGHEVEVARDGLEALAKLKLDIDLVILDAAMPNMDGFEVAQRIRADPDCLDLPIIMVTGLDSKADRLRAVEVGVNDFISKPFEIPELQLRSAWLLKLKEAHDAIKRHHTELERIVDRRTAALREALEEAAEAQRETYAAHLDTIRRLVIAAEYKDRDTAAHIERIGRLSALLARGLNLSPGRVELIRYAAPMHDVGKIGVPDSVLLKPGKLDEDEWELMKQHTTIGGRILHGSPSELLRLGEMIALSHHERWDGSGYPKGTARDDIPLEGRICAVADVFDALTSDRHYRDALPNDTVYAMMEAQSERHFDPDVLEAFFRERSDVEAIQQEYAEAREHSQEGTA